LPALATRELYGQLWPLHCQLVRIAATGSRDAATITLVTETETGEGGWFGVRCVFERSPESARDLGPGEHAYEERVTIWYASSADAAIEMAESEAEEYSYASGAKYTGLAQSYWLEAEPAEGAVVFSLVRKSNLEPDSYVDAFFDTGLEYEESVGE
jgi:hypothetical protein